MTSACDGVIRFEGFENGPVEGAVYDVGVLDWEVSRLA